MLSLSAALILDALLGEPRWLWSRLPHPVVLIGRAIAWCEARLNVGGAKRLKGTALVAGLSAASIAIGWGLSVLPLSWLWEILFAAILIAHRSLIDHVRAVADALRQGIAEGRLAVSMIVGRDTREMDTSAVARAAIESAGENFSDGVIAPALWFGLFGLPGILLYKTVNTADSMIGHRTERYEAFGWAAARLDDVLNWVPARVTAALITFAHGMPRAWRAAWREGPRHRSPNAGWPEAALARILDVAVSGPRSYGSVTEDQPFVNPDGRREIGPDDIDAACHALWRCWVAFLTIVTVFGLGHLALT